jgi:hypothetical protein
MKKPVKPKTPKPVTKPKVVEVIKAKDYLTLASKDKFAY